MELQILNFLQTLRNPVLDQFFKVYSTLGDHGELWIFLIFFIYFKRKDKRLLFYSFAALLISVIGVELFLKPLIQRPRPFIANPNIELLLRPHGYSFPSGHTATSLALVTFLALNHVSYKRVYITAALLMAFSRLYLYVHYPSDVLAGILLGVFVGFVVNKTMIKLKNTNQKK